MNLEKVGTIVAIVVGIFGITQTLFQILKEIRKERHKLIIHCEKTTEKWSDATDPIHPETRTLLEQLSPTYDAITIHAINNGRFPIVIAKIGFDLSNGRKIEKAVRHDGLPKRIDIGESVSVPFMVTSLQRELTHQPEQYHRLKKMFRNIRLFQRHPRIGDYRLHSPIYFDYVPETKIKRNDP